MSQYQILWIASQSGFNANRRFFTYQLNGAKINEQCTPYVLHSVMLKNMVRVKLMRLR